MKFSEAGEKFLERLEGNKLVAYLDECGIPTIGVGMTRYPNSSTVKLGDTITQEESDKYFRLVLVERIQAVNQALKVPVKQYEFDALVSFCYNVGIAAFTESTLIKMVNKNDSVRTVVEFFNWLRPPGVIPRRRKEAWLFVTGEYK